jgi:preprotein translocase subunit YajC
VVHIALETGLLLAQDAGDGSTTGNPLGFLLPIILIGGVFYLLLVLPQRRRMRKMQELRDSIEIGDEVRTIGGIYGTVTGELGDSFLIDIGSGTTIRVVKRAVAEKVEEPGEGGDDG